jgi:hypothetical protein
MNEQSPAIQLAEDVPMERVRDAGAGRGATQVWTMFACWFAGLVVACIAVRLLHTGLSTLEYIFWLAPLAIAFLMFAEIWSILGEDRRLVRFAILPMVALATSILFAFSIQAPGILLELAKALTLSAMVIILVRQRGFRIACRAGVSRVKVNWRRFSLADMLIVTSGLGVLLGLASLDGVVAVDLAYTGLFASPTLLIVTAGFRGRAAFAILTIPAVLIAVWIGAVYVERFWFDSHYVAVVTNFVPSDWMLIVFLVGLQLVFSLVATAFLRWLGYRLHVVTPQAPLSSDAGAD